MGFLLSEYLYKMKKNVDPIEYYGTQINESLGTIIGVSLAAVLYGRKLFDAIKAMRKEFKDDPEIEAVTADLLAQAERVKDTAERKATEKKKRHTKK